MDKDNPKETIRVLHLNCGGRVFDYTIINKDASRSEIKICEKCHKMKLFDEELITVVLTGLYEPVSTKM